MKPQNRPEYFSILSQPYICQKPINKKKSRPFDRDNQLYLINHFINDGNRFV